MTMTNKQIGTIVEIEDITMVEGTSDIHLTLSAKRNLPGYTNTVETKKYYLLVTQSDINKFKTILGV